MSEAIEKSLREAYRRGYADGWDDALDTGARLLNEMVIAKRKSETVNAEKRSEE